MSNAGSTTRPRGAAATLDTDTIDAVRQKLDLLMLAFEGVKAREEGFMLEWSKDLAPVEALVRELTDLVEDLAV